VLLPMTQMRKGIATQMTRALQAPHAYVQMEIDATHLVAARERAKKAYQAKEDISQPSSHSSRRPPRRSSATRPSMRTGPTTGCRQTAHQHRRRRGDR
jgi:hypothetical protein